MGLKLNQKSDKAMLTDTVEVFNGIVHKGDDIVDRKAGTYGGDYVLGKVHGGSKSSVVADNFRAEENKEDKHRATRNIRASGVIVQRLVGEDTPGLATTFTAREAAAIRPTINWKEMSGKESFEQMFERALKEKGYNGEFTPNRGTFVVEKDGTTEISVNAAATKWGDSHPLVQLLRKGERDVRRLQDAAVGTETSVVGFDGTILMVEGIQTFNWDFRDLMEFLGADHPIITSTLERARNAYETAKTDALKDAATHSNRPITHTRRSQKDTARRDAGMDVLKEYAKAKLA